MAYDSDLYNWEPQPIGAPLLTPNNSGPVDIHGKYQWTLSNNVARNTIPYIFLEEYKLVLSSEVSGFLYNLRGEVDTLNVISKDVIPNADRQISKSNITQPLKGNISKFLTNLQTSTEKVAAATTEIAEKVAGKDFVSDTATNGDKIGLTPYRGLYAVEPTDWTYKFPYFGAANMLDPKNTWGESSVIKDSLGKIGGGFGKLMSKGDEGKDTSAGGAGGGAGGALKGIFDIYKGATTAALAAGGGLAGEAARETPVSFTGTGTDSVEVTFYLFNTVDVSDIKRNWEFCYLFTYQNLANRKGINLLDPPCLYKAYISGYKQMPICYIDSLSITNIGTTRLIDIRDGSISETDATSPFVKMVPEAYKVTFKLTGLLKNARNIFQFVEDPSGSITVTGS